MLSFETAIQIVEYKDPQKVADTLAQVDQLALYEAYRSILSFILWDRKSPINGVAAEKVLASHPEIPVDAPIYLILQGDRVLYFQPFRRGVEGYQSLVDAHSEGMEHLHELAESMANAATIQWIMERLPRPAG